MFILEPNSQIRIGLKALRYFLVDVFTNRRFCGNQLAVFPEATGLRKETMQKIARELNLSESAFVFPPSDSSKTCCRVRIFTPSEELPMAGHPTLGTAFVLSLLGRFHTSKVAGSELKTEVVFEEGVGSIPVTMEYDRNGNPDFISMRQPRPIFGPICKEADGVAAMLSLDRKSISDKGLPVQVVSCGVPFLFVPIADLVSIGKIRFRTDVSEKLLRKYGVKNVLAFTLEVENKSSFVHSRMFAPGLGIAEDPATGSASGPLGSYLVQHGVLNANPEVEFVSEQGMEIGRPSRIRVRIGKNSLGQFENVLVSGQCVMVGEGRLRRK